MRTYNFKLPEVPHTRSSRGLVDCGGGQYQPQRTSNATQTSTSTSTHQGPSALQFPSHRCSTQTSSLVSFRRPSSLQAPSPRHCAHVSPATDLPPSATLIHSLTGVSSNPKCLWGCSVLNSSALREYDVASGNVLRATVHQEE